MAACSSLPGRHLILLLGVCFLILGSNCVPISRTKNLMLMDVSSSVTDHRLISGNTSLVDESWEIEKMGGRLNYLEVNDYPGPGANNRHTPKGHG